MTTSRRHRRSKHSAKQVGLARFRAEHWPRWIETVDDRATWDETHAQWQQNVQAMAERLHRAGLEVIWVDLEPESFAAWCRERGLRNDAEARSRFAAERIGNLPGPDQPG
jgi:hypothetical protein